MKIKSRFLFLVSVIVLPFQSFAAKGAADLTPTRLQIGIFTGVARSIEKEGTIIDLSLRIRLHPHANPSVELPTGLVFFLWDEQNKRKLVATVRAEPVVDKVFGRSILVEFKGIEQIVTAQGWKFSVSIDARHEEAYVKTSRGMRMNASIKSLDSIRVSGDPGIEFFTK